MGEKPGTTTPARTDTRPGRRPMGMLLVVAVGVVVVAAAASALLALRDGGGLDSPEGLAVDTAGNLYIADSGNHRVHRVDRAGVITTVAGTGVRGFSGDGGPASEAKLNLTFAIGLAMDSAGNLYIADSGNHRIRRVDRAGVITTVAGTGVRGFSGDGGPAPAAKLDLANRGKLAVDSVGNLYIAHYGDRIRRVDPAGIITTVARLDDPDGLAVDAAGNLYVSVGLNEVVRRDPAGVVTTVAGGEQDPHELGFPEGLAVDAAGNLYIADTIHNRVLRVDPAGVETTVAGTGEEGFSGDGGPATAAELALMPVSAFAGLAVDALGNLYIADLGNHRVRRVDRAGVITTVAGGRRGEGNRFQSSAELARAAGCTEFVPGGRGRSPAPRSDPADCSRPIRARAGSDRSSPCTWLTTPVTPSGSPGFSGSTSVASHRKTAPTPDLNRPPWCRARTGLLTRTPPRHA